MVPELIKSDIKLTIGMLVSNHIGTIRNCMESLKPLLETVPSELVVVDTKGAESDGSIRIVREYTEHIYPFSWCDDFSAARNFCLSHARGEWFLYLDDDEWFDDVQELIDFFVTGECENYFSGYYYTRDYAADGSYSMGIAGRMVRRTVATEFVGRVHETFCEVYAPNKLFSCFTHHYGYAFADEEAKRRHQERNLLLLEKELEAEGYTPRICAQMTQELLGLQKTAEQGAIFCKESIAGLTERGLEKDSCTQWLFVALARYYAGGSQQKEALEQMIRLTKEHPLKQMAQLAISGLIITVAAKKLEYETIARETSVYLSCYEWLKKHPEEALMQMQMDLPSYYNEAYRANVLQAGAVAENRLGRYETAYEYWKEFPWKSKGYQGSRNREELLITLRGLKNKEPLISYYQHFYKQEWFQKENREHLPRECREALNQQEEKKIIVSVSLLVSNRRDTIEKCLESIRPLLTAVPSELIVVDTVGEENSDGSLAIARRYADTVVHFDWCGDFSAARNAGLSKARGEWFLFLDDDEWFEDVEPLIRFFQDGEYQSYDSGVYVVRNYLDREGTKYSNSLADRMRRLDANTRFEGKIHEQLRPVANKVRQFSCFVHHYGYAYQNEEEKKKHTERNLTLLQKEWEEHPMNDRILAHLIQEYVSAERYEEAVKLCREGLRRYAGKSESPFVQYLAVMLLRLLTHNKEELAFAEAEFYRMGKEFPWKELPRLIWTKEFLCLEKELGHAEKVLELAISWLSQRAGLRDMEQYLYPQIIFDFERYLREEEKRDIITEGMYCMLQTGDDTSAEVLVKEIAWSDKEYVPYQEMLWLLELYGRTGREELFLPCAEQILQHTLLKKPFFEALQDMILRYPMRRESVSAWLSGLQKKEREKKQPPKSDMPAKAVVSPELQRLSEQLKENIRTLALSGNREQAKQLYKELLTFLPKDEELQELQQLLEEK